jgi:methyl-accepting chemotaxis protein
MSGAAAKEISNLLEQSSDKVKSIVEEIKYNIETGVRDSKVKMDRGMEIASKVEKTLVFAAEKVEKVTHLMSEIASATKEQALGVSEIGKAMNMLDQANHKNSETAEQAADLARSLELQANNLLESIADLEKRIGYKAVISVVTNKVVNLDRASNNSNHSSYVSMQNDSGEHQGRSGRNRTAV